MTEKKIVQSRAEEKESCRANCIVGLTDCTCLIEWHLGNHLKLHILYLATTLHCVAMSSWTLVAKHTCKKTLMDNHDLKVIKNYALLTVILLELFAFKVVAL